MLTADDDETPTARARRLVASGRREEAEAVIAAMIGENFGLVVTTAAINADWSSLNSLNGRIDTADGRRFFFKFHQEEGEEETVGEYYRAELLERAGLPVDMPAMICRRPGHQILLYAFRRDRQLAAVCLDMERSGDDRERDQIARLQADLDRLTGRVYVRTLHPSSASLSGREAIHQLFHNRLVNPAGALGGRVERFYLGQEMALPGVSLPFADFAKLRWTINGMDYARTVGELFAESRERLSPANLGACGGVIAHGDAHNANVWIEKGDSDSRLVLFDPAFAGEHVPALLADVKATFHNIFAHPLWLYHPAEADCRFSVAVTVAGDRISVDHDWRLSRIREDFLGLKVEMIWRPLLAALHDRGLLPTDWRRVVRVALFCCPTLVMSLRAGASHGSTAGRSPAMSALSFAISVMAGSEPDGREDVVSRFLDAIAPD